MLEESKETNFQIKEAAMDVSFKELQLKIVNVIYKTTVQTETNETIVEVDIHCCQMEAAEKRSCQRRLVPNDVIIMIEEIASDPE